MKRRSLLVPLALAAACTDPEPVALEACAAIPQLATDAAGLTALTAVLDPRELELLQAAAPTLGLEKVGSEGLAKLRSEASCVVDQVDSAGSGRWAVKLTRTLPTVAADGTLGEPATQSLDWQVVDGADGAYVESGMRFAVTKRESLRDAIAEKDFMKLAAGWRGIHQSFPDPVITVDIAEAETLDAGWAYRKKLEPQGAGALDKELVALELMNTGDKAVASGLFDLSFTHGGAKEVVRLTAGAIAPGETVQLQGTPKGPLAPDVGGFDVEAVEIRLAP